MRDEHVERTIAEGIIRENEHPPPSALWFQALDEAEHGEVPSASERYRQLMIEHGYLLKPGDEGYDPDPNLPCGWPGKSPDA